LRTSALVSNTAALDAGLMNTATVDAMLASC